MSRSFRKAVFAAPLLLSLCGAATPLALACGFHGGLDESFSAMHPRSLGVAFAIRDAVEGRAIQRSVLEPVSPGGRGYWRAVGRLNTLTALLSASANHPSSTVPARTISVLFIDSGLWSRIAIDPGGLQLEVHTKGAQPGDIVIVTSESVLAEVLAQRLSADAALSREVIAIDVPGPDAEKARAFLVEALDRRPPLTSLPRPAARLFGPRP
jgi:hypothetical protein